MAGRSESPNFSIDYPVEDRIQSNCGLFAMIDVSDFPGPQDMKSMMLLGGTTLQHRAEGGAGYFVFDRQGNMDSVKGKDTIAVAFQNGRLIPDVPNARIAILHTRYPTAGGSEHEPNIQPLHHEGVTFAHHGNLTNAIEIIESMPDIKMGGDYPDNDSWIALNAISRAPGESLAKKMVNAQKKFEGGWAFIATDGKNMVASRDPEGIRPLFIGRVGPKEDPQSYALSVETAPYDILGIDDFWEVLPGETIQIKGKELSRVDLSPASQQRSCIFEVVYMMHPDSTYMGQEIYNSRRNAGRALWKEQPVELEENEELLVMPVPDSGRPSALGYFKESRRNLGRQVDYDEGLLINRYVGRNFIKPKGQRSPSLKFFNIEKIVSGKNIVLVDDSFIRGETMEGISTMLREAGASKVHVRIASPEVKRPCHWGVAIPSYEELSSYKYPDIEERARVHRLDSLGYLSLEGLFEASGATDDTKEHFCAYCFGGNGPKMSNHNNPGTIKLNEAVNLQ